MEEILRKISLPVDHPDFFAKVHREVAKMEEEHLTAVVRSTLKTRELAKSIIADTKNILDSTRLEKAIATLQEQLHPLSPWHAEDAPYNEHILAVLKWLAVDKEAVATLKTITKPFRHQYAEQLIKETLALPAGHIVTDSDTRRAVVAALLTYFRQTVGSCFATAPALLIHREQPLRFLRDCKELLETGRLKRTYEGMEYVIPMSPSWGMGMLRKPILADQHRGASVQTKEFLFALQAAGVLDPSLSPQEAGREAAHLLKAAMPLLHKGIVTYEAVLRAILLIHNQVEESDLKTAEVPEGDFLQQQLLVETKKKGKSNRIVMIRRFQDQLKAATHAFRSMTENPILRTWEFTLASFSESKADFAKWNLYFSLGMRPEEPGGIGQVLYNYLTKLMEQYKVEFEALQSQYERVFLEAKALESQYRRVETDTKAAWVRSEYTMRLNDIDKLVEQRDELAKKNNRISGMLAFLVEAYLAKLPEYFQEIYDAEMFVATGDFYDDSPAGFRLLFKHGRTNPQSWTMIYNPKQFVSSLSEFFTLTETDLRSKPEIEGLEKEFTGCVSEIIRHLGTHQFLETSFDRVARAHGVLPIAKPLDNLDKIAKKPWAYTSGGTMSTLISCLYGRSSPPTETSRWVESPSELLVFYIDTLKEMGSQLSRFYLDNPKRSMLAYSPSHAFVLKPGTDPLCQGWVETEYTYTWVRDHLIAPRQAYIRSLRLNAHEIERLGEILTADLPEEFGHALRVEIAKLPSDVNPSRFRIDLVEHLFKHPLIQRLGRIPFSLEEIDGLLYSSLPLFSRDQLRDKVEAILHHILGHKEELSPALWYEFAPQHHILSAKDLAQITYSTILLSTKREAFSRDMRLEVALAMQALGYAMPRPIFFADTNWTNNFFGFVLSPASEELELWRLDYTGLSGRPMHVWKHWLDGSDKKAWGIYTQPQEYGQM